MEQNPKITVFTQAFNTADFIRPCIESILNQTYTNWQYFLVDSGSNDGTTEIIREYAEKDSRILPIYLEKNITGAKSFCVELLKQHCTSGYAVILDSDDYYDLNFMKEMLQVAQEEDADFVVTGHRHLYLETGASKICLLPEERKVWRDKAKQYQELQHWGRICTTMWCTLIHHSIIEQLDIYTVSRRISNSGDAIFAKECAFLCKTMVVHPKILLTYIVRPDSVYRTFNISRFRSGDLLSLQQHKRLDQLNLLRNEKLAGIPDGHSHIYESVLALLDTTQISQTEKWNIMTSAFSSPQYLDYYHLSEKLNFYPFFNNSKSTIPKKISKQEEEGKAWLAAFTAAFPFLNSDSQLSFPQIQKIQGDQKALALVTAHNMQEIMQFLNKSSDALLRVAMVKLMGSSLQLGSYDDETILEQFQPILAVLSGNPSEGLEHFVTILLDGLPCHNPYQLAKLTQTTAMLANHAPAFVFACKEKCVHELDTEQWIEAARSFEMIAETSKPEAEDFLSQLSESAQKILTETPLFSAQESVIVDCQTIFFGLDVVERQGFFGKNLLITGCSQPLAFQICQFFHWYGKKLGLKQIYCMDDFSQEVPAWLKELEASPNFTILSGTCKNSNFPQMEPPELVLHLEDWCSDHPAQEGFQGMLDFYKEKNFKSCVVASPQETDADLMDAFHKEKDNLPLSLVKFQEIFGADPLNLPDFAQELRSAVKNQSDFTLNETIPNHFTSPADAVLITLKALLYPLHPNVNMWKNRDFPAIFVGSSLEKGLSPQDFLALYEKIAKETLEFKGSLQYKGDAPETAEVDLYHTRLMLEYTPSFDLTQAIRSHLMQK